MPLGFDLALSEVLELLTECSLGLVWYLHLIVMVSVLSDFASNF